MTLYESNDTFQHDGVAYRHTDLIPDFEKEPAKRFTYGQEPHVIAQVPLLNGGTVEIHGYAAHWTSGHVSVEWLDDSGEKFGCWVPAGQVRRAGDDEWHGRWMPH